MGKCFSKQPEITVHNINKLYEDYHKLYNEVKELRKKLKIMHNIIIKDNYKNEDSNKSFRISNTSTLDLDKISPKLSSENRKPSINFITTAYNC